MRRLQDIALNLCPPEEKLAAVMKRFNELLQPFVTVTDADCRPLGTVTDGDIRRAILDGTSLDTRIAEIMNAKPLIAKLADPEAAHRILADFPFVPMIDESGRLREIWYLSARESRIGTALVMAGGFGRRLGAMTKTRPKPLLTVGDKPILGHILDWLEESGIRNICVSIHYLGDRIRDFLDRRGGAVTPGVIEESESLGTAGALGNLPDSGSGPVLVINGDVLTKLDIEAFERFHHAHGYDCTMAVSPYRVSIPFGVAKQDQNGVFERVEEKPTYTYFVAAGVYLLENAFCHLVPPGTRMDMPDLINIGRNAGLKVGLFPIHEYWIDVGRPDDLRNAERDHRRNNGEGGADS